MTTYIFGSDRPYLYDIEPWNRLGFGVANWGDNLGTLNKPIHRLADEIGKTQLFLMTHIDAQRTQAPSPNTVQRLGKACNRIRDVLASRQKDYTQLRVEEGHATSDVIPWTIHPAPYFGSMIVRNGWLEEYNRLVMIALTNIYQHSDNNLSLTVTEKFANDIYVYFNEIKLLVGVELLSLPQADVLSSDFRFADTHYAGYDPNSFTINYEALDTPGAIMSRATEDDLRLLFEGIPSVLIRNHLKQYPVDDPTTDWQGTPLPIDASAPGTADGSAIAAPGRTLGEPLI